VTACSPASTTDRFLTRPESILIRLQSTLAEIDDGPVYVIGACSLIDYNGDKTWFTPPESPHRVQLPCYLSDSSISVETNSSNLSEDITSLVSESISSSESHIWELVSAAHGHIEIMEATIEMMKRVLTAKSLPYDRGDHNTETGLLQGVTAANGTNCINPNLNNLNPDFAGRRESNRNSRYTDSVEAGPISEKPDVNTTEKLYNEDLQYFKSNMCLHNTSGSKFCQCDLNENVWSSQQFTMLTGAAEQITSSVSEESNAGPEHQKRMKKLTCMKRLKTKAGAQLRGIWRSSN